MNLVDSFAREILSVLAVFARVVLRVLDFIEATLRSIASGSGIGVNLQTLLLILVLALLLFGTLRMLSGPLRVIAGLMLVLLIAHTLSRVAQGPLG